MTRSILSLLLCFAMMLPVYAQAANALEAPLSSSESREITREEYLEVLAAQKGISLAEADELDRIQTENAYAAEKARAALRGRNATETISLRAVVYKTMAENFVVGSFGNFDSKVRATVHTKLTRYHSTEYGTYQNFVEVLSKGALAIGTGVATWTTAAMSTGIEPGFNAYGNKLIMMLSGVSEHIFNKSYSHGVNLAGFGFGYTTRRKYYYRKSADIHHTFLSNYDLT